MTKLLFPKDGFADTCLGYKRPEHGDDAVGASVLCGACEAALNADVDAQSRRVHPTACGNCRDHVCGSRYYDCLCCYGD